MRINPPRGQRVVTGASAGDCRPCEGVIADRPAPVAPRAITARVVPAMCVALMVLSGCAATSPRGYPVSGRIGVAAGAPPVVQVPSVGGSVLEGFVTGLVAPEFAAPMLFFLGPLFAPIVAARAGECTNKLHVAYPGVADRFREIFPREFVPADLHGQIATAIRERTSAGVIEVDTAHTAGPASGAAIGQAQPDYVLSIEIRRVGLEPIASTACARWGGPARGRSQPVERERAQSCVDICCRPLAGPDSAAVDRAAGTQAAARRTRRAPPTSASRV